MWVDCTRQASTRSMAYLEDHDHRVHLWCGVPLPKLPHGALASIYEVAAEGHIAIQVRVFTSRGQYIALKEPRNEFPSDTMIAQIMLVA